jgi:hypothetical protein
MSASIEQPVPAQPGALWRLWRWCRRNPEIAGLAALCLVQVFTTVILGGASAVRIRQLALENQELRLKNEELRRSLDVRAGP